MKKAGLLLGLVFGLLLFSGPSAAHFGMVIPSQSSVSTNKDATLRFDLKFWHPFENEGMDLEKPVSFNVFHEGKAVDLLPTLTEGKERGHRVWTTKYVLKRPGQYAFVMDPVAYYEKGENTFIRHVTKVYVDAFGQDEGWDKPLGLDAEIVPLVRPGALYAGNLFQGQVLRGGKPDAHAKIEVEWFPGPNLRGVAPHSGMVTQAVVADADGVFSYVAPAAGWWGFAALKAAKHTLKHGGVDKPVEEGAVVWMYFHALRPAVPAK